MVNEVISAVNDIGIVTLPDGRHIILAVYINDSVSVNPDNVIAETGVLSELKNHAYRTRFGQHRADPSPYP